MCVRLVVLPIRPDMYMSIHQVYSYIRIGTSYRFYIHQYLHKYQVSSLDILVGIDSDKFHRNWEYKFRPDYKRPGRPVDTDLECNFTIDTETLFEIQILFV